MKESVTKLILVAFLFSFFSSCSIIHFSTDYDIVEEYEKDFITPTEVSIRDWLTYLVVTNFPNSDSLIFLGDHKKEIQSKLPDITEPGWNSYVFEAFLRSSDDMEVQWVLNHCTEEYIGISISSSAWDTISNLFLDELPVVGISYEQAMGYVDYKQELVNTCGLKKKGYDAKRFRYECFLPRPTQFDSVLSFNDSLNAKGCNLFNYKNSLCLDCPGSKKILKDPVASKVGKAPVGIFSYFPDVTGLYNLKGNVAEMTSTKGIAKGGSFEHYAREAMPGHEQDYSKPESWLGFRIWYKVYLD